MQELMRQELISYWNSRHASRLEIFFEGENIHLIFEDLEVNIREDYELEKIFRDLIGSEIVLGDRRTNERELSFAWQFIENEVFSSKSLKKTDSRENRIISLFYTICLTNTLIEEPIRQIAWDLHRRFLDNLIVSDLDAKRQAEISFENFLARCTQLQRERDEFVQKLERETDPVKLSDILKRVRKANKANSARHLLIERGAIFALSLIQGIFSASITAILMPEILISIGNFVTIPFLSPSVTGFLLIVFIMLIIFSAILLAMDRFKIRQYQKQDIAAKLREQWGPLGR
jgi:hypothetical protein